MTLDRKTADPRQMTAAAMKVAREYLGLTTAWIAGRMHVQERTVHRWEAGVSPIPEGVRIEMDYLQILADDEVDTLTQELLDQPDPALVTYRTDADYRRADPDSPWLASWHRAVAARVAREVSGLEIDYWQQ